MRVQHEDVVDIVSIGVGRDLLTVIALAAVMLYLDLLLSLLAVCVVPPALFSLAGLSHRIREVSSKEYKSMAGIAATAQEAVQGIKVVKSFTLERLMERRTTIVIAHRLSTIARADRTYAIEAGEIVESGSPNSLIAGNRLYARLFVTANQSAGAGGTDPAKDWQIAG